MVIHFWGRCPSRIGFSFGSLATALFGFSLLFQPCAVFADSIPYAADIGYSGWSIEGDYIADPTADIYPTQDALCQRAMLLRTGFPSAATYTHFTYTVRPVRGDCWYSHPILITGRIIDGWARELACPRGGLPEDRMAEVPMCSCPPGQKFPPSVVWWQGPWCIPDTTTTCPGDDLLPYGPPDIYPLDTANLTNRAKAAVSCLATCSGQSQTALLSSAYRPEAYQKHLREVWDKWKELELESDPDCAARRAQVEKEFNDHKLGASTIRPSIGGCHPAGGCVDVHRSFTDTVDFCSTQCNVYRPWPGQDPVHVLPF